MLPKIKKNIFQIKTQKSKQKTYNIKKFLIGIIFAGTAMVNTSQASMSKNNLNEIITKQKAPIFILSHSNRIGESFYHSSHSSHSSHRSHYSSRY